MSRPSVTRPAVAQQSAPDLPLDIVDIERRARQLRAEAFGEMIAGMRTSLSGLLRRVRPHAGRIA